VAWLCLLGLGAGSAPAQGRRDTFDIGSGGLPTITGALQGSVTGSASIFSNLVVTVNFGELSPINTNSVVKVVVPVAIRSTEPYRVTAAVTGTTGGSPNQVQLSDIGFGVQNLRSLGRRASRCGGNSIINPTFNNDPALSVNLMGRAAYPSTLASLGASTVILNGPELTRGRVRPRRTDNGWAFDAVLAVAPQFYAPSNFTLTLTFTISPGPAFRC
jgi:hypothetical protein